jgi:hypothetical protein
LVQRRKVQMGFASGVAQKVGDYGQAGIIQPRKWYISTRPALALKITFRKSDAHFPSDFVSLTRCGFGRANAVRVCCGLNFANDVCGSELRKLN